jgi:hypothetical protein
MQVMLILPELVLIFTVLVLFAASLKKIKGGSLTSIALAGSFLTLVATVLGAQLPAVCLSAPIRLMVFLS